MTPRLVTVLRTPSSLRPDAVEARIPSGRRDRLTIAWPGAASDPPLALIGAAKRAGFARVRLFCRAAEIEAAALADAIAAGLDEVEILRDGPAPWEFLRQARGEGRLAFVALRVQDARLDAEVDPGNPCGADAFVLEIGTDGPGPWAARRVEVATGRFRKVAVRGWPLCAFPTLSEARVISNALVADLHDPDDPGGSARLRVPFEDSSRMFLPACGACRLSLACDGLPAASARTGETTVFHARAFDDGPSCDLPLDPTAFALRMHPDTFLAGQVHLRAVAAGIRPCGRIVVDTGDAARQEEAMRAVGLRTARVSVHEAPRDRDAGSGARGTALDHVFFSRGDQARAAADLQARFAASQEGSRPMDPAAFGRDLGRLLGYPECCIEAFVTAGPDASTSSLLRQAHHRTRVFHWPLNVLDPVSPFTLIPHLPCRFDCPASLELAARVLDVLDGVFPFLPGAARRALSRTWLWWDATRGAILQGPADPDGLGAGCGLPDSPLLRPGVRLEPPAQDFVQRVLPALASGDRLRLDGGIVRVLAAGTPVTDLDEGVEPLIFPFGSRG